MTHKSGAGRTEGSGIFQNVPACDRSLTSTELNAPIKEDTVLMWPELLIPIGKSNYGSL